MTTYRCRPAPWLEVIAAVGRASRGSETWVRKVGWWIGEEKERREERGCKWSDGECWSSNFCFCFCCFSFCGFGGRWLAVGGRLGGRGCWLRCAALLELSLILIANQLHTNGPMDGQTVEGCMLGSAGTAGQYQTLRVFWVCLAVQLRCRQTAKQRASCAAPWTDMTETRPATCIPCRRLQQ